MRKIIFLMPHDGIVPSGGYKVVYEYANRLAKDGFWVSIVYPNTKKGCLKSFKERVKDVARYVVRYLNKGYQSKWFRLDKRINLKWVWSLDNYAPEAGSCVFATAIETAFSLNKYSDDISKFYFIQDYENWFFSDQQVIESYRFPMKKIVIAKWLQELVSSCGEYATFIPNGFDFKTFSYVKPIDEREKYSIVCMYHVDKRKGMDVAFRAFNRVYEKFPQIKVTFFSVYDCPTGLPQYGEFVKQPDVSLLNSLYNKSAIYVGSSNMEGWGLTVGEAMQCGCAVACTDNRGYLEMARHGETALTSPVGDAEALADNIISFIENDELRIRIALAGKNFIQSFDINKSYESFKDVIITSK